jgi:hypothetical protein
MRFNAQLTGTWNMPCAGKAGTGIFKLNLLNQAMMDRARPSLLVVTKANGTFEPFSVEKFQRSLRRAGASEAAIEGVTRQVLTQFENGMSTRELYRYAFSLLKAGRTNRSVAARYRLKQAIVALGPSGFPFERFVAELLKSQGFATQVGQLLSGRCVRHEVDVVATKAETYRLVECKYHNRRGDVTDVKVSLYFHARFLDLCASSHDRLPAPDIEGWLVTNTRFTDDAQRYGVCAGLQLLSWDFPSGAGLREMIDAGALYPITCLTTLSAAEKRLLLEHDVLLCRNLIDDPVALGSAGVRGGRYETVLEEVRGLVTS